MIDNEWGMSSYPLVAGHEVIGRVAALGNAAQDKGLKVGQKVGIGWTARSCGHCDACISGNHVNCLEGSVPTIINRGGFADKLRADWQWAGQFDLIINTVAVDLDWQPYFEALAYGGNFHTVGAVMKPFPVPAFTLIGGDRSISGSATGNPSELRKLMKFAGRSKVAPTTELFPMSQINEALKHVREGKARYRVVLKADF